ncbi:hypothetical protein OAS39_13045 [Pirellulales bacterium]|nr:hypothetical protein [Pirellulales bacterium]
MNRSRGVTICGNRQPVTATWFSQSLIAGGFIARGSFRSTEYVRSDSSTSGNNTHSAGELLLLCEMPNIQGKTKWLSRVLTWDGLLPAAIWTAPLLVSQLLPNSRASIEIAAVALPIVAFFVRYRVGVHAISLNSCTPHTRRIQMVAFVFGLAVLVLIDAVMILTYVMPDGAAFRTLADLVIWGMLFATYLGTMVLAMYPGAE